MPGDIAGYSAQDRTSPAGGKDRRPGRRCKYDSGIRGNIGAYPYHGQNEGDQIGRNADQNFFHQGNEKSHFLNKPDAQCHDHHQPDRRKVHVSFDEIHQKRLEHTRRQQVFHRYGHFFADDAGFTRTGRIGR